MVYSMNSVPHVPLGPLGPWSCMGMWHGNVAWSSIRNPEKNGWSTPTVKMDGHLKRWANVPSSGYGGINTTNMKIFYGIWMKYVVSNVPWMWWDMTYLPGHDNVYIWMIVTYIQYINTVLPLVKQFVSRYELVVWNPRPIKVMPLLS